jgi:autotransporter-associated beta strand protein
VGIQAGSATWATNPTTGDWNTAGNWDPKTVPNGPSDIATFDTSTQSIVAFSEITEVESILFQADAVPFTITVPASFELTLSGTGIQNDSGSTQTFVQGDGGGTLTFRNNANAGQMTTFLQESSIAPNGNGLVQFLDTSSAGSGLFINDGVNQHPGRLFFFDSSTAEEASFSNQGNITFNEQSNAGNAAFENEIRPDGRAAGSITFNDRTSAADGSFINHGGTKSFNGSLIQFFNFSTADHASFTCEGSQGPNLGEAGGKVWFWDDSTAGNATFTIEGSNFNGSLGGEVQFLGLTPHASTADNAVFVLKSGSNNGSGGFAGFFGGASGGTAQLILEGNGATTDPTLFFDHDVAIGSLAGHGIVEMGLAIQGFNTLTLGGNNLSFSFAGTMSGGTGSHLVKEGTGRFELTGPNTYTGGTTITAGSLVVNNTTDSATGSGPVQVNAGFLGGGGIIAGAVTVGTGSGTRAFLAPAHGAPRQTTLNLQSSLIFNSDAIYQCTFKARSNEARTDTVIANGVTINGATFSFKGSLQGTLTAGLTLTMINNTSTLPITGTFNNLADGKVLSVGGAKFQANYEGGDGNDLTLTVVP